MNCPECKTGVLGVVETFPEELSRYCHYRCKDCGEDVVTKEEMSPVDLRELRRIKALKRRGESALNAARRHAGNPFAGLLR